MRLLLTPVFCALCPLLASATVVTSGTINISGSSTGDFNLSGLDFSASGGMYLDNWSVTKCLPCGPPPATVDVNGIQTGTDFAPGNATVGATTFASINWGSSDPNADQPIGTHFQVSGPPIVLNDGPGIYQGTFSFVGSLCGNPPGGSAAATSCVVGLPNLTGSGIVSLSTITVPGSNGALEYTSAIYAFTPEPRSLTLSLIGVVTFLAWCRKLA